MEVSSAGARAIDWSELSRNIAKSRHACSHGGLLTRALVVLDSLEEIALFDLTCGIHDFPKTKLAYARMHGKEQGSTAQSGATGTTIAVVRPRELVLQFYENPEMYYLVPRDALLEHEGTIQVLTFLTLRNAPGVAKLQYQVVTFRFGNDQNLLVSASIQEHLNAPDEVRMKMINAMKQIKRMAVLPGNETLYGMELEVDNDHNRDSESRDSQDTGPGARQIKLIKRRKSKNKVVMESSATDTNYHSSS